MAAPSDALSRRRLLRSLAGIGIGSLTGAAAWGYAYERHRLELTRTTVPVSQLPAALAGLRIGLLTDVHRSQTVPDTLVRQAVARLQAESPDLIVLGGDYVTWGERGFVEPSAEALSTLTAPHGVFAVLGNHDDDRDMPAALARRGFAVLRDQRTSLTVRGERIDLGGLRFWTRKPSDIDRVMRDTRGFRILLAHDPRRVVDADRLGVPLILSGHTHGGQVNLPGIRELATRKFPTASGLLWRNDTTLFVSRGVGTVYIPVRINCPPEVVVLTLERRRAQGSGLRAQGLGLRA